MVVPSPATSLVLEATSRTIWAPMFSSGSLSSISFATVTPSLVMVGSAELLLENHVPALGTEGHFHGVGELVHAAQNRLTGGFGIYNLFRHLV